MAQQGRALTEQEKKQIARMSQVASVRATAKELNVDTKTVQKYKQKKS